MARQVRLESEKDPDIEKEYKEAKNGDGDRVGAARLT
jgi:hypothetical protein